MITFFYKKMDKIPPYDIKKIHLKNYNDETRNIILSNFKKYTKLIEFYCYGCDLNELPDLPNSLRNLYCGNNNLTKLPKLPNSLIKLYCDRNNLIKLPDLPNSLTELYCNNNNLTEAPDFDFINPFTKVWCYNNDITYLNKDIKTINENNSKNRTIKRMKLLNRNLLLEHSAMITMNPKRIERLLDNKEIDFFDGSFDNLTF